MGSQQTSVPVLVHLGGEVLNLFKEQPAGGPLFPYLSGVRAATGLQNLLHVAVSLALPA